MHKTKPKPKPRSKAPLAGGARAIAFINCLTHTKGVWAGRPFDLRAWQCEYLGELFKLSNETGRRQYRSSLLMIPRKNGKSELAAAMALYGLLGDGEQGAEVYLAASDKDQAGIVFAVMVGMIRNDARLLGLCEIIESQKRIVVRSTGSICRAISSEAYTKHGLNASLIVCDELHAWPDRELFDVLATSTGARAQPLIVEISTAGYDRNSLCFEHYEHAIKVRDGITPDPSFYPKIYEAPPDADWTDEKVWYACNPALDDFRSIDEMREKAIRARAIPAQENAFRRLYLNQWTEQAERWIALEAWDACKAPEPAPLERRKCFVGMDLSSVRDLTALAAVYPDKTGPGFDVRMAFFLPREQVPLRPRVPYKQWADEGWITLTPGAVVDYEAVRARLKEWDREYDLIDLGFDPWNASDLVTRLQGTDGFLCVQIRQGFASLSAPSKMLETAIVAVHLRHDGNPVLRWCVSNVQLETDPAGNIKPSKSASSEKIDGVIALVMAIDRMTRQNPESPPEFQVMILKGR